MLAKSLDANPCPCRPAYVWCQNIAKTAATGILSESPSPRLPELVEATVHDDLAGGQELTNSVTGINACKTYDPNHAETLLDNAKPPLTRGFMSEWS